MISVWLVGVSSVVWWETFLKVLYLISVLTMEADCPDLRSRPATDSDRERSTRWAVSLSAASWLKVVELPIPLASACSTTTPESSMPLAYSQSSTPWLFRWAEITLRSAQARSPIVRISSLRSVSTLEWPHIKSEDTGRGHSLCRISLA